MREDRNWEFGRVGAGEVELGNQIRGQHIGRSPDHVVVTRAVEAVPSDDRCSH